MLTVEDINKIEDPIERRKAQDTDYTTTSKKRT